MMFLFPKNEEMVTLPFEVIRYGILPYLSLEDTMLNRDKSPFIEDEYQRRIQDILMNGKDYQILLFGLITQEPLVLERFFAEMDTLDDFLFGIADIIQNTPDDVFFDLLEGIIVARDTEILTKYVPLTTIFVDEYDDFIEDIGNIQDRATRRATFRQYLADYTDDDIEIEKSCWVWKNITASVFEWGDISNRMLKESIQSAIRQKKVIPIEFILVGYTDFPEHLLLELADRVMVEMPERYQEFMDIVF